LTTYVIFLKTSIVKYHQNNKDGDNVKILLYFNSEKLIRKSGIGRALIHQEKALTLNNIEYTTDCNDKFDVAHINTIYSKSYKIAKSCKKKGIFLVVHAHSTIEDFKNSFRFWKLLTPIFNMMLKRIYSIADIIITPTEYSKKLVEKYNFIKCPVINISNGIDLRLYKRYIVQYQLESTLRNYYKIPLDTKIVLGVGWLFERKGFIDFVKIAKEMPEVSFVWLGKKNKLFLTNKVRKAIKNKTNNVHLVGYVDESIVRAFLNIASCFTFLSYEETEGIALLEALACKCPVVVRDVEVFDYLTNEVDCYKGDNNLEFKKKINQIINSNNRVITENGYKIALERNLDEIGKKLLSVYKLGKNK
jgi:1,2-diacylglycerol-3-alpha-glucose alpha-1,2-glucosyltransferase